MLDDQKRQAGDKRAKAMLRLLWKLHRTEDDLYWSQKEADAWRWTAIIVVVVAIGATAAWIVK